MATVHVHLCQISATTSQVNAGSHQVLVDRPASKGGTDLGPMGGELFLASVGGCFMSNLLAAIRARDAPVAGVQTEVTGTLTDTPPRFSALDLRVTADSADPTLLEKLVEIADRGCIMMNTLRGKLDIHIHIARQEPVSYSAKM